MKTKTFIITPDFIKEEMMKDLKFAIYKQNKIYEKPVTIMTKRMGYELSGFTDGKEIFGPFIFKKITQTEQTK